MLTFPQGIILQSGCAGCPEPAILEKNLIKCQNLVALVSWDATHLMDASAFPVAQAPSQMSRPCPAAKFVNLERGVGKRRMAASSATTAWLDGTVARQIKDARSASQVSSQARRANQIVPVARVDNGQKITLRASVNSALQI